VWQGIRCRVLGIEYGDHVYERSGGFVRKLVVKNQPFLKALFQRGYISCRLTPVSIVTRALLLQGIALRGPRIPPGRGTQMSV
jgi:hypothetical protein